MDGALRVPVPFGPPPLRARVSDVTVVLGEDGDPDGGWVTAADEVAAAALLERVVALCGADPADRREWFVDQDFRTWRPSPRGPRPFEPASRAPGVAFLVLTHHFLLGRDHRDYVLSPWCLMTEAERAAQRRRDEAELAGIAEGIRLLRAGPEEP